MLNIIPGQIDLFEFISRSWYAGECCLGSSANLYPQSLRRALSRGYRGYLTYSRQPKLRPLLGLFE